MSSDNPESANNEGFMSRWSRRKQEVELEAQADELAKAGELDEALANDAVGPEALNQEALDQKQIKTPEEIKKEKLAELNALTDEDMPDIETLGDDSDYTGFMSENVSEGLRKIALQKLFHGKGFNVRDGLDEYDDDYTKFEKLDPSVITADMKHMIEVEAKRLAEKEELEAQEARELAERGEFDESDVEDMDDSFDDETEGDESENELAETGYGSVDKIAYDEFGNHIDKNIESDIDSNTNKTTHT